jgi:hypothetical protein
MLRVAPVAVPVGFGVFCYSVPFCLRVIIVFRDIYLCNNYSLFITFGYL